MLRIYEGFPPYLNEIDACDTLVMKWFEPGHTKMVLA